jgi:hypothetical protein
MESEMSARNHLARKPPMGWNSYDAYSCSVVESEVRANAEFMARHLAKFGWQYVVVDFGWSFSTLPLDEKTVGVELIDEYGRQLPETARFPSSVGGAGFKPLADYVHGLGLRFGIHLMRGIPRVAVERNLPIFGTTARAADIADRVNVCTWSGVKWGVDMSKPGAQEYYDSVLALAAEWGADFLKWDDMSAPYRTAEIEAACKAIQKCGRPMILSLSPGDKSNLPNAEHVKSHCEMWRVSPDVWDTWRQVKVQFELGALWAPHAGPGCWPDADMLPLGHLSLRDPFRPDRICTLTQDEQRTLMTLWVMCRSPLMIGSDLPTIDPFALSLLTNPDVINVNQNSANSRELLQEGDAIVWAAEAVGSRAKYLAFFNLSDSGSARIEIALKNLGIAGRCHVRDLWKKTGAGHVKGNFAATIPSHGAGLYRIARDR